MRIASVLSLLNILVAVGNAQTKDNIPSVKIGTQIWTSKNLDVNTFSNGDLIPEARTYEEWKNECDSHRPAWCYYNNDSTNRRKFGKLYNWFAVNDPRGLCQSGWHIPSDQEWAILTEALGGADEAGAFLKSDFGWSDSRGKSGNGVNDSRFTGLPGGYRKGNNRDGGEFSGLGYNGIWWSSTTTDLIWEGERLRARFRNWMLNYISDGMVGTYGSENSGLSVRCILGDSKPPVKN